MLPRGDIVCSTTQVTDPLYDAGTHVDWFILGLFA
jgi:hypothetical protein